MKKKWRNKNFICYLAILVISLTPFYYFGCGPSEESQPLVAQDPLSAELNYISSEIENSIQGNIAYNPPKKMKLYAIHELSLLLSPNLTSDELKKIIEEKNSLLGEHVDIKTATLNITPEMKAELRGLDTKAFDINPYNTDPIQLVGNKQPTEWLWSIKALKGGTQTLILTLHRLIRYRHDNYWRLIEAYRDDIEIEVSILERFKTFDWKWLIGSVLVPILVGTGLLAFFIKRRKRTKNKKNNG